MSKSTSKESSIVLQLLVLLCLICTICPLDIILFLDFYYLHLQIILQHKMLLLFIVLGVCASNTSGFTVSRMNNKGKTDNVALIPSSVQYYWTVLTWLFCCVSFPLVFLALHDGLGSKLLLGFSGSCRREADGCCAKHCSIFFHQNTCIF